MALSCIDIVIRKFEFVAKTQIFNDHSPLFLFPSALSRLSPPFSSTFLPSLLPSLFSILFPKISWNRLFLFSSLVKPFSVLFHLALLLLSAFLLQTFFSDLSSPLLQTFPPLPQTFLPPSFIPFPCASDLSFSLLQICPPPCLRPFPPCLRTFFLLP